MYKGSIPALKANFAHIGKSIKTMGAELTLRFSLIFFLRAAAMALAGTIPCHM
jgi:hypothetical protein